MDPNQAYSAAEVERMMKLQDVLHNPSGVFRFVGTPNSRHDSKEGVLFRPFHWSAMN